MAGGYFTKQADFRNAKFLNDVNDTVVGGAISTLPAGFTQFQQTQPGDRLCLDDLTALALSDTTVGTLFGGIYMYVGTLSSSAASPAVGTIAFTRAADLVSTVAYQVTADVQPTTTNPGLVVGIFINAVTKGNFGWIQICGIASVLFDSSVVATTAGSLVSAKASASVASTADNGVTVSQITVAAMIGVSTTTVTTSTISKVMMTRGFGRI